MKNLPNNLIALIGTIEVAVIMVVLVFITLYFLGCTPPRNSVYCYDNYKGKYTICPSGYLPGMEFDSRWK